MPDFLPSPLTRLEAYRRLLAAPLDSADQERIGFVPTAPPPAVLAVVTGADASPRGPNWTLQAGGTSPAADARLLSLVGR
jgi:hypothetical protein